MKKTLLILALMPLAVMQVYAEPIYTDYEFIGYIDQKQENDELYKYEEEKIYTFYRGEEENIEYMESVEPIHGESVDSEDYIEKEILEEKRREGTNKVYNIYKVQHNNRGSSTIDISDVDNSKPVIWDYEVKLSGKKIEPLINKDQRSEIRIALLTTEHLENIELTLKYKTDVPIEISIRYPFVASSDGFEHKFQLDPEESEVTFKYLLEEDYDKFTEDNNLIGENSTKYYINKVKYYKHYDFVIKDIIETKENYVEGYTLDSNLTKTIYIVYKRERIEEDTMDTVVDDKPIDPPKYTVDNEIKKTESKEVSIKSNTNIENKIDLAYKTVDNQSKLKDETIKEYEEKTEVKTENDKKEQDEKCEESEHDHLSLILQTIGLTLCGYSIIETIIHFLSVKFGKNHD